MSFSKLFVYGLVSLGLAMPPSFSQAQEYYHQTTGLCCGKFRIIDFLRDASILHRPNKLAQTGEDLAKSAAYAAGLWVVTVAADKLTLATRIFKRTTVDKIRGLGPASLVLASAAGVFFVFGIGLDLINRSTANYVASADGAEYYMSSPQAFQAYLNLPLEEQAQIAGEAAARGKPQLAELVHQLAQAVESADQLVN